MNDDHIPDPSNINDIQESISLTCGESPKGYNRVLCPRTLSDMNIVSSDIVYKPRKESRSELIMETVKQILIDSQYPDVTINIKGKCFQCHLALLQCYSDYFMSFTGSEAIQLPENMITPLGFQLVYDWMKADSPKLRRSGIIDMYTAARYLQIKELLNQFWYCFDDINLFDEDTAFHFYIESCKFDSNLLQNLILARVSKFFLCAVATKEYLELSENEVVALLSSNYIAVNSEMEVFMSAVRWLHYKWPERECSMQRLMEQIRFSLMPAWFLTSIYTKQTNELIQTIIKTPTINDMVQNGISFSIACQFVGSEVPVRDILKMEKPVERQWIVDKSCKHHHKYNCSNFEHITFDSFNKYMLLIIEAGPNYWKSFEYLKNKPCMPCCCDIVP